MPTGKHDNHRGGRPRRQHKSKLVAVHFATDDEVQEYMQLTPRERYEILDAAKTIASYIDLSEYSEDGEFAKAILLIRSLSRK